MKKRLLSLIRSIIVPVILISFIPLSPASAAGILVNSNQDVVDANGGSCAGMVIGDLPGPDGSTTLREAICAANGTAGMDTITFSNNLTITLAGSQLPTITSEISILGNGETNTIIQASSCNPVTLPGGCTPANHRVLEIAGGTLILSDLTIRNGNSIPDGGGILLTNGSLSLEGCTIRDNATNGDGGGIYKEIGTIPYIDKSTFMGNQAFEYGGAVFSNMGPITSITDSRFQDNTATTMHAGCIFNNATIGTIENSVFAGNSAGFHGGCIYNPTLSFITTISNSTFIDNSAVDNAGAIRNRGRITLIKDCTFSGNTSDDGGAIHTYTHSVISTIENTLFRDNTATTGGAIYNDRSTITTIKNSTFDVNHADVGAGIYNNQTISTITGTTFDSNRAIAGGAIYNNNTLTTLVNSTFSGNSASNDGGALYNNGTVDTIAFSTFYRNWADDIGGGILNMGTINTISNTIVTYSSSGGNCRGSNPGTNDNNLTDGIGCWPSWPKTLNYLQHFGPLTNNGGLTETHALIATTPANPAINAGPASCSGAPVNDQDQRGVIRSNHGNCDIGAFEYTGSDMELVVASSKPADGSTTKNLKYIEVSFNKGVVDDGGPDAANNPSNYLLLEAGSNGYFDTQSCLGGVQSDDQNIVINTIDYDGTNYTATLTPDPSPLPAGNYRLFVCGTTSIFDLIGLELNNGLSDTLIDITVPGLASTLPSTGFPPGRITSLPEQTATNSYNHYTDLWLEIPSLGLEMEIVGIPFVDHGWDVTWLGDQAGYLSGTAFPTWEGNTVITAHVWNSWNKPGPFAELRKLQYGDRFSIHAYGKVHTYEVLDNRQLDPGNLSILNHSDYDLVTLLTCEGWNITAKDYMYRRAVQGILVDID